MEFDSPKLDLEQKGRLLVFPSSYENVSVSPLQWDPLDLTVLVSL